MKTFFGLYLSADVIDAIRARAPEFSTSMSELVSAFVEEGLQRPAEEITALLAKRPNPRGRLAGKPTKAENAVLAGFDRLLKNSEGAWRFSHWDIAHESGLRPKEAFMALKGLENRKMVTGYAEDKLDAWGRPVRSYWRRIDEKGETIKAPSDPFPIPAKP